MTEVTQVTEVTEVTQVTQSRIDDDFRGPAGTQALKSTEQLV